MSLRVAFPSNRVFTIDGDPVPSRCVRCGEHPVKSVRLRGYPSSHNHDKYQVVGYCLTCVMVLRACGSSSYELSPCESWTLISVAEWKEIVLEAETAQLAEYIHTI